MTSKYNIPQKATVKAMHGGGTNDPFTARMLFGMLKIRDHFYQDKERLEFDSLFTPIYQNILEAKYVKDQYIEMEKVHRMNIHSEKTAKYENGVIRVDEDISFSLNIWFKDFFIRGHIALDCLKRLTKKIFGVNIEFFFSNNYKFKNGLEKFQAQYKSGLFTHFIKTLVAERKNWIEPFVEMRIKIEHDGFKLDSPVYRVINNKIVVIYPKIADKEIPETLELLWDSLFNFCEDIIVMLFASRLKGDEPFSIMYIPEELRDPIMPVKYQVAITPPRELLEKIY
jgi:hypothetical protein